MIATGLHTLLDAERLEDFFAEVERSFEERRRFIAWTQIHRKLVVLDLDAGEITRARYAPCDTREEAESLIAQITGGLQ